MCRRLILVFAFAFSFTTLTPLLASAQVGAQAAAGDTYVSPTYGYGLTYDATWQVTDESSEQTSDGTTDFLAVTDETADVYFVGYATSGDAMDCLQADIDWLRQADGVTDVAPATDEQGEPMIVGDEGAASGLFAYSFTSGRGRPQDGLAYMSCQALVGGEAMLEITVLTAATAFDAEWPAIEALLGGLVVSAGAAPTGGDSGGEGGSGASSEQLGAYLVTVADDVDAMWTDAFAAAELDYTSPGFVVVTELVSTDCGDVEPGFANAFYCPFDRSVYVDPVFAEELADRYGEVALALLVAHEWGHHLQQLLDIAATSVTTSLSSPTSLQAELQADCFAGVWASDAQARGLLATGAIETAIVVLAQVLGDQPGAQSTNYDEEHGSGELRTWWFLQGSHGDTDACLA